MLLALEKRPDSGEAGGAEPHQADTSDGTGAAQFLKHPNGERIGEPVHPVGCVAQIPLFQRAATRYVEQGRPHPHRIPARTQERPIDREPGAGAAPQITR